MKTNTSWFHPLRFGPAAKLTSILTLVTFINYSSGFAQQQQQPQFVTQKRAVEVALERAEAITRKLNEVNRRMDELEKLTQIQQNAIARTVAAAADPDVAKETKKSAQDQFEKLQETLKKAKDTHQTSLVNVLSPVLNTDGPLSKMREITKDTPKEEVEKIVDQAKKDAQKIADEANRTLDDFRTKARQLPKEVLSQVKDKALAEVKKAVSEKQKELRTVVRSYLPPELQVALDKDPDLSHFVTRLLKEKNKYPELAYAILQTVAPDGQSLDQFINVPGLGDSVQQFQQASLAHDAAGQTAAVVQTLMTTAMMTGNPYIIAAAAIISILLFVFGGDGGGDGDGNANGKGKGSGDEGSDVSDSGTPSPGPNPEPKPDSELSKNPTTGGGNITVNPAIKGFSPDEKGDGSLTVNGPRITKPFVIPRSAVANLRKQLVLGEPNPTEAVLVFSGWKASQYVDSMSYDADRDVLRIVLGNGGEPKPKFQIRGKEVSYFEVVLAFHRAGNQVTGSIESEQRNRREK